MKSVAKLFVVVFVVAGVAAPASSQVHQVNAACCGFQDPANGNSNQSFVTPGTTVQWTRIDAINHTVTDGTVPGAGSGLIFNGSLSAATPSFQFTFNTLGTFPYFCSPHFGFGMVGTVFVVPPASVTSTGSGCNTSAGQATLGTTGLPTLGNANFGFTIGGGPVGAQTYLFLATSVGPALPVSPGCNVYLDFPSLNAFMMAGITPNGPVQVGPGGTALFSFPVPAVGALGGITAALQALVLDPLAPGGLAISNAVTIVVGA